jgi:hypothetical protein
MRAHKPGRPYAADPGDSVKEHRLQRDTEADVVKGS